MPLPSQAIPGVLEYEGARIQLLDLPGIVEGASQGRGRGLTHPPPAYLLIYHNRVNRHEGQEWGYTDNVPLMRLRR